LKFFTDQVVTYLKKLVLGQRKDTIYILTNNIFTNVSLLVNLYQCD